MKTKNITLAAMFLALGILFPQIFHAIPNAGLILLPMHIPVFLCGFICGPLYGLLVGFITPILSNIIFAMPLAHMLMQMIVELSMYGFMSGLLSSLIKINNVLLKNYIVLIVSMIVGRLVYGLANNYIFRAGSYSLQIWLSSAFITSIPGIIIQLSIIPILVIWIKKLIR